MANANGSSESNVTSTKRGNLMLGELPNEFLRMPSSGATQDQVAIDGQIAQRIAAEEVRRQNMQTQPALIADRLFISVLEAKLNKNYGMVRMDPYCRVRINHNVYETDTAYNGAKNPHWTKTISVPYASQTKTLYVEVFDERALTTDSRIAWADITLPERVKSGEEVDDWWPLSGKMGDEQEGSIHVVITKKTVQQVTPTPSVPYMMPPVNYQVPLNAQMYYPGTAGMTAPYHPQQMAQNPVPEGPLFTDADVKQLKELFPDTDEEAIKTVLEASRGNKDAAINSLLSMQ